MFGAAQPLGKTYDAIEARLRLAGAGVDFEEKPPENPGRERCIRLAEEGDPFRALSELAGYDRWPRQAKAFMRDLVEKPLVIGLGGHKTSKTFGLSAINLLWFWQCIGSLPDETGEPQGCIITIVGPGEKVVLGPAYRRGYLAHATRARAYTRKRPDLWGAGGLTIEGYDNASHASVNWVADKSTWLFQAYFPSPKAGDDPDLMHQMSGLHHPTNDHVHLEEAAALTEMHFATVDGIGAKHASCVLNPVNPTGPVFRRSTHPDYATHELSQVDHENVLLRKIWIPGGPDHLELERKLRDPAQVTRIGLATEERQDHARGHFLYALPERDWEDKPGPREDGIPGHPDAEVQVFEPTRVFSGQRLGRYLLTASSGILFPPVAWKGCVEQTNSPRKGVPDVVGVDCAEVSDRATAAPWYGPSARVALLEMDRLKDAGVEHRIAAKAALKCYDCQGTGNRGQCLACEGRGIYRPQLGKVRLLNRDDSAEKKAMDLLSGRLFPIERRAGAVVRPAFHVDPSGGGYALEVALRQRGVQNVSLINFGSHQLPAPRMGTTPPLNLRAAVYQDLGYLVEYEMVELPDQPELADEARIITAEEVDQASGKKGRLQRMKIKDKKELKKLNGNRSLDLIDSVALASCGFPPQGAQVVTEAPGLEEWL